MHFENVGFPCISVIFVSFELQVNIEMHFRVCLKFDFLEITEVHFHILFVNII